MAAVPPDAYAKLTKVFALTGSNVDGEALVALRRAQDLATKLGTSLPEALSAGAQQSIDLRRIQQLETDAYERGRRAGVEEGRSLAAPDAPQNWLDTVRLCHQHSMQHPDALSAWETDFVRDFVERGRAIPTPKQQAVIERIAAKCGVSLPPGQGIPF